MNREEDRENLAEARPYIRSVVALVLFMRFARTDESPRTEQDLVDAAYVTADRFLAQLEKDLES